MEAVYTPSTTVIPMPTTEERAAWGRKGGQATAAKGRDHMSQLGKAGFAALTAKCNGDAKAAFAYLRDRGRFGNKSLAGYYRHIAQTGNVDLTYDQYEEGKR